MERRVLKLGGRSYWDGMEGAEWKELEGMVDMDGMEGMDGIPCKDTTFLWYCQVWGRDKEMFEMCFQIESS